mmetsp:Transcript_27507/g.92583  ORF Transcript_27507/g.92583 Transcript_27507/m.92583 type:complete len:319 (+) Transcript_27507:370-1326(+)
MRDTHTPTYAAIIAGGSRTESSADPAAESPSMSAFASGVRVTAESVAVMRLITHTGISAEGTMATRLCAIAAAAKKSGKMMPPGKPPAHARAMATSFAAPTWSAAAPVCHGELTLTTARAHIAAESPGHTSPRAVRPPSRTGCSEPSPQKRACGKYRPSTPTQSPTAPLTSTWRVRGPHHRRSTSHVSSAGATGHIAFRRAATRSTKPRPMTAPPTPAPSAIAAKARPVSASPTKPYAKWPQMGAAGASSDLAVIRDAHDAHTAGVSASYASLFRPADGRVISSTKSAPATGMPMNAVSAPAAPAKAITRALASSDAP